MTETTKYARSRDGRTIHRGWCKRARVPWHAREGSTDLDVLATASTYGYRFCRVCWQRGNATLDHHVEWTFDALGPEARFSCSAPEGSDCRQQCAEKCGAESWPCYSYDDETGEEREHPRVDSGECNALPWFENALPEDTYNGPDDVPLSSGPIEIDWDNDGYTWRYPGKPKVAGR